MLLQRHPRPECPVFDAEKDRKARTIDVGIEQSDSQPVACECEGQVHSDGTLADAALPGPYSDDMADRRQADSTSSGVSRTA